MHAAVIPLVPAAPDVRFIVQTEQQCIGSALVRVGAPLVEGSSREAEGQALFVPPKALCDERGIRMPLKDERHSNTPVASMTVQIRLHVQPPELGS